MEAPGSAAFKQMRLAQKIKTAKLSDSDGPFPSVEQLCEAKDFKLAMGLPRVSPSSVYRFLRNGKAGESPKKRGPPS